MDTSTPNLESSQPISKHELSVHQPDIIFVARHSKHGMVARSIVFRFHEKGSASVQAIGVEANYQAAKALAIAVEDLAKEGIRIAFTVGFTKTFINDDERTALRYDVFNLDSGSS